mmetsp:Transcript_677/g.1964  ORF Transcript_677/g.1964 Transcript_677/m.1964 type:complete len:427 (-) Transcript_677:70-1350(-)
MATWKCTFCALPSPLCSALACSASAALSSPSIGSSTAGVGSALGTRLARRTLTPRISDRRRGARRPPKRRSPSASTSTCRLTRSSGVVATCSVAARPTRPLSSAARCSPCMRKRCSISGGSSRITCHAGVALGACSRSAPAVARVAAATLRSDLGRSVQPLLGAAVWGGARRAGWRSSSSGKPGRTTAVSWSAQKFADGSRKSSRSSLVCGRAPPKMTIASPPSNGSTVWPMEGERSAACGRWTSAQWRPTNRSRTHRPGSHAREQSASSTTARSRTMLMATRSGGAGWTAGRHSHDPAPKLASGSHTHVSPWESSPPKVPPPPPKMTRAGNSLPRRSQAAAPWRARGPGPVSGPAIPSSSNSTHSAATSMAPPPASPGSAAFTAMPADSSHSGGLRESTPMSQMGCCAKLCPPHTWRRPPTAVSV